MSAHELFHINAIMFTFSALIGIIGNKDFWLAMAGLLMITASIIGLFITF